MVHEQVSVKVNARVDRGIAALVSALNTFSNVITVESCEGRDGNDAHVAFLVGNDHRDLAEFIRELSISLGNDRSISDRFFVLSIEWCAGGENPLGYLRVSPQHIAALAEAITSVAAARSTQGVLP